MNNDSYQNPAACPQPAPADSGHPPIVDLVIADLTARSEFGKIKYGKLLRGFDDRDTLMDAYQEALDLSKYLRKTIYERDYLDDEMEKIEQEQPMKIDFNVWPAVIVFTGAAIATWATFSLIEAFF